MLGLNSGVLLGFVVGDFYSFRVAPMILQTITLLFIACFISFPETPRFLISKGKIDVGLAREPKSMTKFVKSDLIAGRQKIPVLLPQHEKIV